MPRNMSFSLTIEQMRNRTKTVTRRNGWEFLKPGDIVNAVEKAMGLKKGEKIKRIGQIRIISTRFELLDKITQEDVVKEGFPDWTPREFITMYADHYGFIASSMILVNRIEFEHCIEVRKGQWRRLGPKDPSMEERRAILNRNLFALNLDWRK
jgi:hypothetical protein